MKEFKDTIQKYLDQRVAEGEMYLELMGKLRRNA